MFCIVQTYHVIKCRQESLVEGQGQHSHNSDTNKVRKSARNVTLFEAFTDRKTR
jgi:hypothetical protein